MGPIANSKNCICDPRNLGHGDEVITYEGLQVQGEHDDCVLSFCLANWGRLHGWEAHEETADLRDYLPPTGLPASPSGTLLGYLPPPSINVPGLMPNPPGWNGYVFGDSGFGPGNEPWQGYVF